MLPLDCLFWIWSRKNKAVHVTFSHGDVVINIGGAGSRLLTNQGRPSGGRVLPTVAAVDAMPLDQLVGRGVRPEMVRRLDFGVLQSTRPNCGNMGGGFQSVFSMSE